VSGDTRVPFRGRGVGEGLLAVGEQHVPWLPAAQVAGHEDVHRAHVTDHGRFVFHQLAYLEHDGDTLATAGGGHEIKRCEGPGMRICWQLSPIDGLRCDDVACRALSRQPTTHPW